MRISGPSAAALLLLASCDNAEGPADAPANGNTGAAEAPAGTPATSANAAKQDPSQPTAAARWDLQSSGEGSALALAPASGPAAIRLFCPAGGRTLLVNVPGFRPIGSEERLSFGSGGHAEALVADSRGDRQRGGVSGTGAVPANLAALIGGPVSASYGAQRSGPHPAPPGELARSFVAACREAGGGQAPPPPGMTATGPCHVQSGQPIRVAPIRALGTEPFWNARVEGRCVTYSHPEDQRGTRVWTRYAAGANGAGTWSGALGGRPFELRVRPQAGCSDGMSDNRYPLAADLIVGGERRSGCAEPL
jgi:uncharacterized membrane protein